MRNTPLSLALLALLLAAGCGGDGDQEVPARARPVTALTLQRSAPARSKAVTGVVEPYREADVGFEVGGRIEYVVDVGREVQGAVLDETGGVVLDAAGAPVEPGDVIAALDSTRYEQAVRSTELKIASAHLSLESLAIELEEVLRADLESAEAQLEAAELEIQAAKEDVTAAQSAFNLAEMTVERDRKLVADDIAPQNQLDASQNEFERARAALARSRTTVSGKERARDAAAATAAKARGSIKLKQAQIETAKAEIAELEAALDQARTDLEDCVLRAPFSGRITAVHLTRGAFVQAGGAVVTLTLVDPVKISVTVSAEDDRRIVLGSRARIAAPGLPEGLGLDGALPGIVREKSQVADPSTRTYRIDVMVRNFREHLSGPSGAEVPLVDRLVPVVERLAGGGGPLYVLSGSLYEEDGRRFVLRLPGFTFRGFEAVSTGEVLQPEKIPVTLGDEFFTVIQWPFRSLAESGDLKVGDVLVENPTAAHLDGVVVDRFDWLFRPGELVPVTFELGAKPAGFYVPIHAIRERNGRTSVLLLDGDRAREVWVTAHEAHEELRRIEAAELQEGARIVVDGAHFVADGEAVRVIGEAGR